jgi:hypothetical protein
MQFMTTIMMFSIPKPSNKLEMLVAWYYVGTYMQNMKNQQTDN